jgi:CBS domain-containing protein
MRVIDIMTFDPACCTPETMLPTVAGLMVQNDCGEIPVVDDLENRKLVGAITDRDIVCRAIAAGRDPMNTNVAAVMSSPVVSIEEEADLDECCEKMEQYQIRRIPVVDAAGRVCGIIAQADIASLAGLREIAEVVKEISQPPTSH